MSKTRTDHNPSSHAERLMRSFEKAQSLGFAGSSVQWAEWFISHHYRTLFRLAVQAGTYKSYQFEEYLLETMRLMHKPKKIPSVFPEVKLLPSIVEELGEALGNDVRDRYLQAATEGSAGIDLRYIGRETLTILPGQTVKVGSGICIWIKDPSMVGLIFPRSGRGSKGLIIGNGTGVIDADYTGELQLTLWNRLKSETITVEPGERVMQYLVMPKFQIVGTVVEEFSGTTERGEGGFGHTGTH